VEKLKLVPKNFIKLKMIPVFKMETKTNPEYQKG